MLIKIRRNLSRLIYNETTFDTHFNVPIKFDQKGVKAVNERIVEIPFVLSAIEHSNRPKKILDFGCSRSWISLALASLGHKVHGIDLREFPFQHENFLFSKIDILDFHQKNFDYVISMSTLEHVGLGAYGEEHDQQALGKVLEIINGLLKSNGTFLLTLPVGIPSIDLFEKSFSTEDILSIVISNNFEVNEEKYFKRLRGTSWLPCTKSEIARVSNNLKARSSYGSGVNGVGCFKFLKC